LWTRWRQYTKIDAVINRDIWMVFVSRIFRQVLIEKGIRYSAPWGEIKATSKERYAGAKKLLARDALSQLRINRYSGESAAEFAHSLGEGTRILNKKVKEEVDNTHYAAVTTGVLDDLCRERIMQQVQDNVEGCPATDGGRSSGPG
jgi:hypothetical protein